MKAGNESYNFKIDLPDKIPVFPLTGALLLPSGQLPLNIFEPRYIEMVNDALHGEKLIGMIQPDLNNLHSDENPPALSKIGCIGRISAFQELGNGQLHINLSGICRFKVIEEIKATTNYRQCKIDAFETDLAEHSTGDEICLLYTSPSPRDKRQSRMPSSA